MNRYQRELFYKQSAKQDFLLSKSDVKPAEVEIKTRISKDLKNELLKSFPGILYGKKFVEHALAQMGATANFSAMLIRIDDPGPRDPATSRPLETEVLMQVAEEIDRLCKRENGVWGLLKTGLLGSFFTEKDATSTQNIGHELRHNLSQDRGETVSIGLAVYPTLHFKNNQILENARKALDHAAFFGSDSMVLFDAVSLNISGDKLYDQGKVEDAAVEYQTAIRLDPANVNVRNSLGVSFGVLGELEKALAEFKIAVSLDPKEVLAVYNMGLVNMLLGHKTRALENLLAAGRLDSEIFEVAYQTGRICLDLKKPRKAKKFLKKAVQLRPTSGSAFSCLGECYAALGLSDKALAAYKKAVTQNSNDAAALSALGWLFAAEGESLEIATLFCKQSVDIAPDNGLFRQRLGRLYLKADRLEDALLQLKEATRLDFDSTPYIEQIENRRVSKAS
jgi:tetratricopeptide (TPR) repeat protein